MEQVLEFFQKGGFVIYPLMLCSVLGLAIVVEKALALRRKSVIIPEIVNILDDIKGSDDISLALSICDRHEGPFANVIRVAWKAAICPRMRLRKPLTTRAGRRCIRWSAAW